MLVGISQLLQRESRIPDITCRYGGEEFALIMPNTTTSDGLIVADRIRTALGTMVWPRHPETNVTISIGLVGCMSSPSDVSPEQWLEAVDRNLYTAKRNGRNRAVSTDLHQIVQNAA